jgi:hypothetical protein
VTVAVAAAPATENRWLPRRTSSAWAPGLTNTAPLWSGACTAWSCRPKSNAGRQVIVKDDGPAYRPLPADQYRPGRISGMPGWRGTVKSTTSPTESVPRNLVTSTLVSGLYSCLVRTASDRTAKQPPLSASRRDANTAGESNCGRQHQSIVPSVTTNATVCRSPMTA